eukprot:352672-Chlamydomonas_euryale.AAC.10
MIQHASWPHGPQGTELVKVAATSRHIARQCGCNVLEAQRCSHERCCGALVCCNSAGSRPPRLHWQRAVPMPQPVGDGKPLSLCRRTVMRTESGASRHPTWVMENLGCDGLCCRAGGANLKEDNARNVSSEMALMASEVRNSAHGRWAGPTQSPRSCTAAARLGPYPPGQSP